MQLGRVAFVEFAREPVDELRSQTRAQRLDTHRSMIT
jgi:hypothetical protein